MSNTTVKIIGPGGVINYEVAIIVAALRMEGFDVEVVNDHPEEDTSVMITHRRSLRFTDKSRKDTVTVVAEHEPWGG